MNITREQLHRQCVELRTKHPEHVQAFKDAADRSDHVDYALLRAIASRETNMHNIVGDGGHGRGYFQIDDRSHKQFLHRAGARGPGRTPNVRLAAEYAVGLIDSGIAAATVYHVPYGQRLRFAIAAYNAGSGPVLKAWRGGDPDRATTGGDYSADVLERAKTIRKAGWA